MEKYRFRIALKQDVERFYLAAMVDPEVAGYLSLGPQAFIPEVDATVGPWSSVTYVNGDCTALGSLNIRRSFRNDVDISGYVLGGDKYLAGRLMLFMKAQLRLVAPNSVNSTVLVTNEASMHITTKLLGPPWGIEPDAGYDGVKGEWVGIAHFRRDWKDLK